VVLYPAAGQPKRVHREDLVIEPAELLLLFGDNDSPIPRERKALRREYGETGIMRYFNYAAPDTDNLGQAAYP
jgi:hypothetical protein